MKYASRSIDGSISRNRETECKIVDEMRNRKMDFGKINFSVDGDSITAGNQWSWHVFNELGFASHHNVAVGSSVWYKRTVEVGDTSVTTQDYGSPDFAGISDGNPVLEIHLTKQWGIIVQGSYFVRRTYYKYHDNVHASTFETKMGVICRL